MRGPRSPARPSFMRSENDPPFTGIQGTYGSLVRTLPLWEPPYIFLWNLVKMSCLREVRTRNRRFL